MQNSGIEHSANYYSFSMMSLKTSPVTFFSLPVELRIQIYEHALVLSGSEHWISSSPPPYSEYRIPPSGPKLFNRPAIPLLRTCRTIYREASAVFYRGNRFKVKVSKSLLHWLQAIGPVNIQHLKALHIIASSRDSNQILWSEVFRTLRDEANGLRDIFVSWKHDLRGDCCIRDPLARIRGLKKLVIDTSVIENFSLEMVRNSQAYLQDAMGIPVLLGPIASETALASCCMQEKHIGREPTA